MRSNHGLPTNGTLRPAILLDISNATKTYECVLNPIVAYDGRRFKRLSECYTKRCKHIQIHQNLNL